MAVLEDHPLAAIFPLMGDADLDALGADIEANGLRDPIWLLDGLILDGRNRYRACVKRDIDHRVEHYRGKDALGFVISKNLHRRHLTESQRAMVAARIVSAKAGDNQHAEVGVNLPLPTRQQAAELLNVSVETVKHARTVQNHGAAELVAAVDAGEVTVSAAAEVAKLPKSEQRKVVKEKKVKEKAAEKRKAKKEPAGEGDEPTADSQPEAAPPAGQPEAEPADPAAESLSRVETLCRDMDQVAARMKALKADRYCYAIHVDSAVAQVEAARKTLWQGRAAHPCPYCEASGEAGCKACGGTTRVKGTTRASGLEAMGVKK